MKSLRLPCVLFFAASAVLVFAPHCAAAQDGNGAVFAMTNAASNNQINAYTRREDGSLEFSGAFPAGGRGALTGTLRLSSRNQTLSISARRWVAPSGVISIH
jgi:hypothetical protein